MDVLFNREGPLIPIKNIYERVIPGLKRNVLSARISKLGVKSITFVEPHLTTVKKFGLSVTGSSHYVTVPDFIKVCKYFKLVPPRNMPRLCDFTSRNAPDEILAAFPEQDSSGLAGAARSEGNSLASYPSGSTEDHYLVPPLANRSDFASGGLHRSGSKPGHVLESRVAKARKTSEGNSPNLDAAVDLRCLTLPNGDQIALLIREGQRAYITHVELSRVLPSKDRSEIETVRNEYSISVNYTSKSEVAALKHLGVVEAKVGRSVLYRASDVAKMFAHWNQSPPECLREVCHGRVSSWLAGCEWLLPFTASTYCT